jgi:1,4-alpha-glucan branching enzyme
MMSDPKKIKAALKTEKDLDPKIGRDNTGSVLPKKRDKSSKGRAEKSSADSLVKTEFSIEATSASSVKLAADFTGWEKSPVDLIKSEHGIWHTIVPLPPGDHSYRYIVDGKWCDDPHSARRIPNPFGTVNAVVSVAAT